MFEKPILLLIFNRPELTQQTFDALRKLKPSNLFVVADGPRPGVPADEERCRAARAIITEQVDWNCKLQTLFRADNLGCGRGPAMAISWFFEQVEEGIILEDDCVPDQTFFPYCAELLALYRHDEAVYMISGTSLFNGWSPARRSYFFCYLGASYGWATWRRAWSAFRYELVDCERELNRKKIRQTLKNEAIYRYFQHEFDKYRLGQPDDVWDFQWTYARWLNGGATLVPTVNLIANIGFTAEATHTFNEKDLLANLPLQPMTFPLKHGARTINRFHDWYFFERYFNPARRPFWKRLLLRAVKLQLADREPGPERITGNDFTNERLLKGEPVLFQHKDDN